MKKFLVRVNAQEFEVEVEEITQKAAKNTPALQSPVKHQITGSGNGHVLAPMPGVITQAHVKIGDIVKADRTVVTLEAMKMENRIPAGKDGRVLDILVSVGQNVTAGELLVVIS
ncbi:pyruvate carboxylase [Desulfosporosinus orientis DSM 765]|uniref:Pyruvate carboxylase n=1 Tax=Desulfosporosinus orientis (strain ATCC 19365 / DSM 765 / NCIMB 8382 / VKM B-1628 / Singapore I) TaxID=768706 RepID=G7WIB1_DESOD|nr:biotin/lipoyl-containing protein [Desulfosporosinus orientis]AET68559.1 pyruvate carboxylase [Desulfosporosinus orientis DSM 765]